MLPYPMPLAVAPPLLKMPLSRFMLVLADATEPVNLLALPCLDGKTT